MPVSKEKIILSVDIFERLKKLTLIDKYEAYQLLDNEWTKIEVDLEIIQTEGFTATKKVVSNIVLRKKNNIEQEVQEGWVGRVLPFELVQETHLKEQLQQLQQNENRLVEITAQYQELLDSFAEEDKEQDTVNEAKTGFVNAVGSISLWQHIIVHKKKMVSIYDAL